MAIFNTLSIVLDQKLLEVILQGVLQVFVVDQDRVLQKACKVLSFTL